MGDRIARIGQWGLIGGALVCLLVFLVLSEGRPTITYTLPDDHDDQEVVVGCQNTSWGFGSRNELSVGEGRSTSFYRVVEGEDAYEAYRDELQDRAFDAARDGDTSEPLTINSAVIEEDCLRANGQRQHQLMWTGFGGLLLAGAAGYVDLRRRPRSRR